MNMNNRLNCPKCKNESIICLKILMTDNSKRYKCLKCNEIFSDVQKQEDEIKINYIKFR